MTDIPSNNHLKEKEEAKIARADRLTRLRGMANLSRADVEEKYGISAETLKNWELGRHTGLTEQGAKRILTALTKAGIHCSLGWLLNGTGSPPVILDEPVKKELKNLNNLAEERAIYSVCPPEVRIYCEAHPHALQYLVTDEGMEPYYAKGDYVAGERYYKKDIQKTIGKDCIVETQTGEILLRRVRAGSKEGCYSLQCTNTLTSHPAPLLYDVELASAAPVVLHRRMNVKSEKS